MLNNIFYYVVHQARDDLVPFIVMRMVKLTLEHGLSPISSTAFAAFGMLNVAIGNIDEGERFGKLALRVLDERFTSKNWLPRVYVSVYALIFIWKYPLRLSINRSAMLIRLDCKRVTLSIPC